MELVIDGMTDYLKVIDAVIESGHRRAPRGQPTREVLGVTVVNERPYDCLPPPWRKPNLAIAAAEGLQLLGGVSYPELMSRIAAPFGNFMDGGIFHGAYGPRIRTQLAHVVDRLKHDPDTRQAVLVIWDPLHDLLITGDDVPRDVPCTLSFQYFLLDGKLEAHVHMRSNDCVLGFAYDHAQFVILADAIAQALGTSVARYVHHVGSLHVYERDLSKIDEMWRQKDRLVDDYEPTLLRAPGFTGQLSNAIDHARKLLRGELAPTTSAEEWYEAVLEKHV